MRPPASPLWDFDCGFSRGIEGRLAGVDEAGVGPLAGPVVAAAVIFYRDRFVEGLNDSKKLTAGKREELFGRLYAMLFLASASSMKKRLIV